MIKHVDSVLSGFPDCIIVNHGISITFVVESKSFCFISLLSVKKVSQRVPFLEPREKLRNGRKYEYRLQSGSCSLRLPKSGSGRCNEGGCPHSVVGHRGPNNIIEG